MDHARKVAWCSAWILLICAGCRRDHPPVFSEIAGPTVLCSQSLGYFPASIAGAAPLYYGAEGAELESMYLERMQEPSLYRCPKIGTGAELRFLWDRSLSFPIAARLVIHQDQSGTLFLHALANSAMPPPPAPGGKPVSIDNWYRQTLNREMPVTREQLDRAVQMVQAIRFATDHSGPVTTDGSDWIFEIEEAGHYRVVDFRNKPPAAAKKLGLFLVTDLGGLTMDRRAIY